MENVLGLYSGVISFFSSKKAEYQFAQIFFRYGEGKRTEKGELILNGFIVLGCWDFS